MNNKNILLGDAVVGKRNNLQFARFIAAILVIISHSFKIASNTPENEWFNKLTNMQIDGGGIAVAFFFFVSGYLITKSMFRMKTCKTFFRARCLRTFPPLVAIVLITVFIFGPIVTTYSLKSYFSDSGTYKYLLNGLLVLQHNLPGIFTSNIFGSTINGSLWTLPLEFLCYIACFALYKIGLLTKKRFLFTIPLVIVGEVIIYYYSGILGVDILKEAIRPTAMFYIGILYYVFKDNILLNKKTAIIACILIVTTSWLGVLNIGMLIFFPYIICYMCFGIKQYFEKLSILGNYSYFIYLSAFPIQQTLVLLSGGNMNPVINMLLAIPITIVFAIVLYYSIEKPITKL